MHSGKVCLVPFPVPDLMPICIPEKQQQGVIIPRVYIKQLLFDTSLFFLENIKTMM
jgi:hypothetical protein